MIQTGKKWEEIANDASRRALLYANDSRDPKWARHKERYRAKSNAWARVSNAIRDALLLEVQGT